MGALLAVAAEADTVADLQERIGVLAAFTGGIVFELDRDGRYQRVWAGEPQLLVVPPEQLIGRTIREFIPAPIGERFHEQIRDVFDTRQPTAFEYSLDVQAGRRTFSCMMNVHERAGSARTVTVLVRDVTLAKALEAKLVQAERLAALGLLAASVGHEIRQPLSYVLTSLDVLERELPGLSADAASSLEKVRAGALRIAEITSSLDLLASQRRRVTAPIDVRRPLQAALDLCGSELSHLRVIRQFDEVPLVNGDEGELCQVFANILLNAAQSLATQKEENATITVDARTIVGAGTEQVRISISDTGRGIEPEHLTRVFDPFFTTREKEGGSGLGLFITRGIVDAHGGSLSVTSNLGRGTTVEVLVPAVPRAARTPLPPEPTTGVRGRALAPAKSPSDAPDAPDALGKRPRPRLSILVVDDEARFLDSLRLALQHEHTVTTSARSSEALALVTADPERFDVVLCDLAMPEVDGAAFYERMSALGVGDRFVLMTGGAFTPRAAEFVSSGVARAIQKPFMLEALLTLLCAFTPGRTAS